MYMVRVHSVDDDGYADSFFDTLKEAIDAYEDILNDSCYDSITFIKLYRCFVDAASGFGNIYFDDILKSDILYPS